MVVSMSAGPVTCMAPVGEEMVSVSVMRRGLLLMEGNVMYKGVNPVPDGAFKNPQTVRCAAGRCLLPLRLLRSLLEPLRVQDRTWRTRVCVSLVLRVLTVSTLALVSIQLQGQVISVVDTGSVMR